MESDQRTDGLAQPVRIQRSTESLFRREYGCDLRRILPTSDLGEEAPWGTALARLRPGEATELHGHDEEELFIFTSGQAIVEIAGVDYSVVAGDAIRIPRNQRHCVRNESDANLEFLSIYWDGEPVYRVPSP